MSERIVLEDRITRLKFLVKKSEPSLLCRLVDATLLAPKFTQVEIENLCKLAFEHNFRTVCVQPVFVPFAVQFFDNKNFRSVGVCTVVNFPLGMGTNSSGVREIQTAIAAGCDEIDFVQNVSWVKEKKWKLIAAQSMAFVHASEGRTTKVILETSELTSDEIRTCTEIHVSCGVDFIKTSTGFSSRGASVADVECIASALEKLERNVGIKASGGIKTLDFTLQLIDAGASRFGASAPIEILNGLKLI